MKKHSIILALTFLTSTATAQIPIMAVDTNYSRAASSVTYILGDTTYNWGVTPNDSVITLFGFNAGSNGYTYMDTVKGSVKLRRVNNAADTGNITLEWVQARTANATTYNLFPSYQKSMDTFLNSNTYNKGTDNLFDNKSANSNDIERLDWLKPGGYSTPTPSQVGIAVFDKGAPNTHDPFCIAAITSLDSAGDPATYGSIVRVVTGDYGDPGPTIFYRILKAQYPNNLVTAGTNAQGIGGVFISLQDLGVTADMPIYGYSLFSGDLPDTATSADLVNYRDSTIFPLNTGNAGGLDLVAVTGLSIATSIILPVTFLNFNAVDNNNDVNLTWSVENETPVERYNVERSADGVNFLTIDKVNSSGAASKSYSYIDNVSSVAANQLYYRIKQYDANGSYHYSKIILVKRNSKISNVLMYPNPVQNNLYLIIPATANDKATISIFNSTGAKVLQFAQLLATGNNSVTIDAAKLSKDTYQVSIKLATADRTITKQFTKQ